MQVKPLEPEMPHTAENILMWFQEILSEYGLTQYSLHTIVSDAASNMTSGNGLNTSFKMLKCLDHRMSTVIKRTFGKVERQVDNVKSKVYLYLEKAPNTFKLIDGCRKLIAHCGRTGMNAKIPGTLKNFAETRWTGLFDSLESLYNQFDVVATLLIEGNKSQLINGIDKKSLLDLMNLLKPITEAIKILESRKVPTLHVVWNQFNKLNKYYSNIDPSEAAEIKELKKIILEEIAEKYEVDDLHRLAAWCDPRQKNRLSMFDVDEVGMERLKTIIFKMALNIIQDINNLGNVNAEHTEKKLKIDDIFEPISSSTSPDETVNREIDSYMLLSVPHVGEDFDILLWWKNNKFNFPLLSQVARSILCIPASSSKPESDFSVAGFIKSPRRANLAPENLDDMLVAMSNMDLVN